MAAPAQFGVYFAVLRKHLVLLGVSAALVVASGVFYVVRQRPVFQSSATLLIDSPQRNLASSSDFGAILAQEQDDLNTQVYLLQRNHEVAAAAVKEIKAKNVDVAAGDYSEDTLPANVKIEFIPGTRLISFSLTGPDRLSLPTAVDAYAAAFKEWSEGASARRSDLQLAEFQKAVDEDEKALRAMQTTEAKLRAEHPEVDFASEKSFDAETLDKLRADLPNLDLQRDRALAEKAAILSALARAGVASSETGGAWALAPKNAGAALETLLVEDEHVGALKCVNENTFVRRFLDQERDALDKDRRLKEQGLKDDGEARKAARQEAEAARAKCGRQIAGVVATELGDLDADLRRHDAIVARMKDLDERVGKENAVRAQFRSIEDDLKQKTRAVDRDTDNLKNFETSMLHDPAEAPGRAAHATRYLRIETPATAAVQIAPKVPLIIGLTAFAAVAVGLGLVLLFEYLDDTIKSKEDFDRYVGLPFLGFIPRIEGKDAANPDTAADARSGSAVAEAFRAVRTSILFSRGDKPVRTILVTSAGPGEGKTTVATNLAITLAQHKGPVLLVDADLRRPRVAKALRIENKIGLTNFLIGEATLDQVVQKTSIEGVFAVTSGPIPPNPAELLHGERLAQLLEQAKGRFDRIVVDSPPVIAVSDARVVARCTDGLYLVISMGKTSWRLIQRSIESLTSIGFEAHGAILNNLAAPTGRYGYYYYRDYEYGKGYYQQQPATET